LFDHIFDFDEDEAAKNKLHPVSSLPPPTEKGGLEVKKLVKQKSLGRTLSTSVLRIKKKRSFWSSEKVGQ
jgi:hypothetical protein